MMNPVFRWLGGTDYDIFISYRRNEGDYYAGALARHLAEEGFRCYLDQHVRETSQDVLPRQIRSAARHSRMLVVVGTDGIASSKWISQEIAAYMQRRKPNVIPVNFGNIMDAAWFKPVRKFQVHDEEPALLATGQPSEHIKGIIVNSFRYRKRNAQLQRSAYGLLLGVVLLLTPVFYYFVAQLKQQQQESDALQAGMVKAQNGLKETQLVLNKSQQEFNAAYRKVQEETVRATAILDSTNNALKISKASMEQLRDQEAILRIRINAIEEMEFDPVKAYRLAQSAWELQPDEKNSDLMQQALAKINLYYKDLQEGWEIKDFKPPYILLTSYYDVNRQHLMVYNMLNGDYQPLKVKPQDAWIFPADSTYRLLVFDEGLFGSKSPMYHLLNSNEEPIGMGLQSRHAHCPLFFGNARIKVPMHEEVTRQPGDVVWNLLTDHRDTLRADVTLKKVTYSPCDILGVKKDGTIAIRNASSLVLADLQGNLVPSAETPLAPGYSINPLSFRFSGWSANEQYIAVWTDYEGMLGIWEPGKKELQWLDYGKWQVTAFRWSSKGSLLAIAGKMPDGSDVRLKIINTADPQYSREIKDLGNAHIWDVIFLPGDECIAVCDDAGYIRIIRIETQAVEAAVRHENIFGLYCAGDCMYSWSNQGFKVWSIHQAPTAKWGFTSSAKRMYSHFAAGDPAYNWLAVVYKANMDAPASFEDTLGIEIRNIRTGLSDTLALPFSSCSKIVFSEDGKFLICYAGFEHMVAIWNTATWERQGFSISRDRDQPLYWKDTLIATKMLRQEDRISIDDVKRHAGWYRSSQQPRVNSSYKGYSRSGWAIHVNYRDAESMSLNCDVSFVPLHPGKLHQIIDPLFWKPNTSRLESFRNVK